MGQKPLLNRMGIFVVAIAVQITASSGIAARLVRTPRSTSNPQTISTAPTNGPVRCGAGIPILVNRPAPHCSTNKNFLMPSRKNTAPTIRRTANIAEETFPKPSFCPPDIPHLTFRIAVVRIAARNRWSVTQSGTKKHPSELRQGGQFQATEISGLVRRGVDSTFRAVFAVRETTSYLGWETSVISASR